MKQLLSSVINLGVKPSYQPWERFFTRKMNMIGLIGGINVISSFIIFPFLGIHDFQIEMLMMSIYTPFVLMANRYINYVAAAYFFYIGACAFMFALSVKMGADSYVIVFYFPLILSMVHLLGRKETFKHFLVISFFILVCVVAVSYCYYHQLFAISFKEETFKILRFFVILLSMTTSILLFTLITFENIKQEELIKKMLREKEILLAEVYHRVKNNMNIITSLLNLRKNLSESTEVKEALEACRNRVYSMSLVHEKFFRQENIEGINFAVYSKELASAIASSFGELPESTIDLECDDFSLDLAQAIPCGLILNELITNAFKHAKPKGKLKITIQLKVVNDNVQLRVADNGEGFNPLENTENSSMGL